MNLGFIAKQYCPRAHSWKNVVVKEVTQRLPDWAICEYHLESLLLLLQMLGSATELLMNGSRMDCDNLDIN